MAIAPDPLPEAPQMPNNFFKRTVAGGTAQSAGDVLRLTAAVDDLNQRNKKLTEVKSQLEVHVRRITAALGQERSNACSRMKSLKIEVEQAQEVELKLRSELATRPAVKAVDPDKFSMSVRAALEQEDADARVAEANAKVVELSERCQALDAEVKLMHERKVADLAAQTVSVDDAEALVAKATEAQARLLELEGHHGVIQDSISHLEALRTSRHEEIEVADQALTSVSEATAASLADSAAAKAQVQTLLLEHGEVAGKIASMNCKLDAMNADAGHVGHAAIGVSGAAAPTGMLGKIDTTMTSRVHELSSCSGGGVAFHFAHDCPIEITSMPVGATSAKRALPAKSVPFSEDLPTDKMVEAVVLDLKGAFQFYADCHSKIGADPIDDTTSPTLEAA